MMEGIGKQKYSDNIMENKKNCTNISKQFIL